MNDTTINISEVAVIKTGYPLRGAAKRAPEGNAHLVQIKDTDATKGVDWSQVITIKAETRKTPDWLQDGDILFLGKGGLYYAVCLDEAKNNALASPHFHVLRVKDENQLLPAFLAWYLNSQSAQKYFASTHQGSDRPYISHEILSSLTISLPSINVQRLIVGASESWKKQQLLLLELIEQKNTLINSILEDSLHRGTPA